MAKVIEASDPHAAWATMNVRTVLRIFAYGLGVGVVTWILYALLSRFVFEPILCRDSVALARCGARHEFASGVAILLGSMVGLVLMVRERVYRPILAIIGVMISLWTLFVIASALPLFLAVTVVALLFGLSYVLFSWLVQPTSLLISIAGVVVVATLARIVLSI